jgi:predicted permease
VAIPLAVLAAILQSHSPWPEVLGVLAVLSFLPCFIFAYVLTILHWKSRYQGKHSDLWGVLLLLETSGWFKLIYIFRHILPDMRGRGRYAGENVVA